MFIHDFVQLDRPFSLVREVVLADDGRWLSALATRACAQGEALRMRIGLDYGHGSLAKEVTVTLGASRLRGDWVTVPIEWRATWTKGLFPTMDGELEISALGENCTHLGLMGHYEPPLGSVGRVLDAVALHHLAERSIRVFLEQIADSFVGGEVGDPALGRKVP